MNTTIRFSDHITTKTNVKTVLIKSTTKPTLVERTINKSILGLKHLSISIKLGLNNDNRKEKSNGQWYEIYNFFTWSLCYMCTCIHGKMLSTNSIVYIITRIYNIVSDLTYNKYINYIKI